MDKLKQDIFALFNRYWDADLTEDEEDAIDAAADTIIKKYGWETVLSAVISYLFASIDSPEKAVNAAHIFWDLRWYEKPVPNPYDFLGFFYYWVNYEADKYDSSDILDSLATSILPKNGMSVADLYNNPYYMPENDPELRKAVECWKKRYEESN